ncbi:hypothetical protein JOC54_003089 [Alkalihalobacillus xiaoxiensis]|uniref:ABC transporter permease n=1 Tax=Shouchella xiaoxiensis TaxID=766895 RepID=A0ABS2SW96_9BACI|nr:hypothetical protein [Shouchella xiaoxiensis]MBM7839809.1 hypothetical protein [Shouchella xiaoxiensis]
MRILFYECLKSVRSPILLALALLFIGFNLFFILSNDHFKGELSIPNELIATYGPEFTKEDLGGLEQEVDQLLLRVNDRLTTYGVQAFTTMEEYIERVGQSTFYQLELDQADLELLMELEVKETYLQQAHSLDEKFAEWSWVEAGEYTIETYGLTGQAATTLRNEYALLEDRFQTVIHNGEHTQWFHANEFYGMHIFLFQDLFRMLVVEALILIVLSTALITSYEYEQRTQLLSFSTKRGRSLMRDKLTASILSSFIWASSLFLPTLIGYFLVFNYSGLWEVSISSGFNWLINQPFIDWWEMTFRDYLIGVIVVLMIGFTLVSAAVWLLTLVIKHTYYSFILFSCCFVLLLLLPAFLPTSTDLLFVAHYTLPTLLIHPQVMFSGNGGMILFKYYELVTLSTWTVMLLLVSILLYNRFKKADIV